MARIASLLLMFALVFTNGPAIASALCRHADAIAHASALESADRAIAAEAAHEEQAAGAGGNKGMLADAASVQLAGFVTPAEPALFVPLPSAEPKVRGADDPDPSGRALRPLLEPPAA